MLLHLWSTVLDVSERVYVHLRLHADYPIPLFNLLNAFPRDEAAEGILLLIVFTFNVVDSSRANNVAPFKRRSLIVGDNDPQVCACPSDSIGDSLADDSKVTGPVSMIKPCYVSWGPCRVDCFIRNKNNNVMHWSRQDGVGHGLEQLDGVIIRNIECISREEGSIDIFVVIPDGKVQVNSMDGFTNVWTGWKWLSIQRLRDAPSCAVGSPTKVDCLGIELGNSQVYTINYSGGKWGSWVSRKFVMRYGCKSSSRKEDFTDYSCVGASSALHFSSTDGAKWNNWVNMDGRLIGQPEVKSMNGHRIDILAVGQKNHLMHLAWVGNAWQKWVNLGGSIVDAPSCVVVGSSLHCFMVKANSRLYRRSLEDGKWSGWISLGGLFIEGPSCLLSDPGKKEISCYLRGPDKRIIERVFTV